MFLRYNVFTISWMVIILLLTLTPGKSMPRTSLWEDLLSFDKFAHLTIFAVLVYLLIIGMSKQYTYHFLKRNALVVALLAGIGYGLIIELIQLLIPGRSFEMADILANSTGCFIGVGLFYLVYKF